MCSKTIDPKDSRGAAGETTPDGLQRLLATADLDPELVRDDLRG
jgi:hypothetical protein